MYKMMENRTAPYLVLLQFSAWLIVITYLMIGASLASPKKMYKLFKVTYVRQADHLNVKITTDLPDNTPLFLGCTKTGLRDNDRWIGCDSVDSKVMGGIAEAKISISGLPKGSYALEVTFNSFWISRPATREPSLQALIGEFGENLQTPYIHTYENDGKKYRMIEFDKIVFHITKESEKIYDAGNTGNPSGSAQRGNLFDSHGDAQTDHKECSAALVAAQTLYRKNTSAWESANLISECMERKGYKWDFNKNGWVKR